MKMLAVLIAVAPLASGAIAMDDAGRSTAATMAVADPSRPDSDTTRDADRKPVQTLVFAGVKSGDKVADYVADAGYFTRLFASIVGPTGHVYAVEPTAFFKFEHFVKEAAQLQGYAVTHPNVTVTTAAALEGLQFPERLDLFWISQNYHDLHDQFMGPVDTAAFNKAVYSALKPGGIYVILDHSAAAGAPANVTETLHRIESSTVRREVEAAGFKFDSESSILANPADPRTARVFDATIRGHTDQFILKFRKPALAGNEMAQVPEAGCALPSEPEEIPAALDAAITGPADKDRACMKALLIPEARMMFVSPGTDGAPTYTLQTLDDWIARVKARGHALLKEKQLKFQIERYGNIAHLWSSYALHSDGKQVARGINSIQAIKEAGGWRVTGILVQAESATAPLPKEYLP